MSKQKFKDLTKEEKLKVVKAAVSTIMFALIVAAFVINLFSCQIGPSVSPVTVTEVETDWSSLISNTNWSLNATNVTSSEEIPEAWYTFTSFTIDQAEQEESGSTHLVTVVAGGIEDSAYLVLQEDGNGTLEVSSSCTFNVHIIELNGSANTGSDYLMRLSLDNQIIELSPAE